MRHRGIPQSVKQAFLLCRPSYWKYLKGWNWRAWYWNLRFDLGMLIGGFTSARRSLPDDPR